MEFSLLFPSNSNTQTMNTNIEHKHPQSSVQNECNSNTNESERGKVYKQGRSGGHPIQPSRLYADGDGELVDEVVIRQP